MRPRAGYYPDRGCCVANCWGAPLRTKAVIQLKTRSSRGTVTQKPMPRQKPVRFSRTVTSTKKPLLASKVAPWLTEAAAKVLRRDVLAWKFDGKGQSANGLFWRCKILDRPICFVPPVTNALPHSAQTPHSWPSRAGLTRKIRRSPPKLYRGRTLTCRMAAVAGRSKRPSSAQVSSWLRPSPGPGRDLKSGSAAGAPCTGTLSEAREAYLQTGTVRAREPHPVIPDQKERKRRRMQRLEGWHKWYCPVCQEHADVKGYNKGQYYTLLWYITSSCINALSLENKIVPCVPK